MIPSLLAAKEINATAAALPIAAPAIAAPFMVLPPPPAPTVLGLVVDISGRVHFCKATDSVVVGVAVDVVTAVDVALLPDVVGTTSGGVVVVIGSRVL